jgi:RNA polymerase sigma factor (sigma-70 family)
VRSAAIPAPVSVRPLWSKRLLALASDEVLVAQIRQGSEAAFTVAFERHAAGLLGFCRHMVGSPEEAEDAVQHTFSAAFRELTRPEERKVALKPWLYAIARNRCLSILRSRRRQATLDFDLPTEGLAEEVERRADLRDLLRDLRELPEEQRAALLLSEAGDLSHAEVADVLGCEVTSVKELVFRARSGLIQRRDARETPCTDIREQLANLRGNSLRRSGLHHHLRCCPGCRAYHEQVSRQRKILRAALPVAPSLALRPGLRSAAGLGCGSASGGLASGIGTGLSASLGAGALVKVAAVGALAGGLASGVAILGHAKELFADSPEVAARAPASSGAEPRAPVGGAAPVKLGVQRDVPVGMGIRISEQRSGAAPPASGRPDGDPSQTEDPNTSRAVLDDETSPSGPARGPEGTVTGAGDESRGPHHSTAAAPANTPVNGGPTNGGARAQAPTRGGPPAGAPPRRGPPAGAPPRRGPPAGAPPRGRPPSDTPTRGGPPAGAPTRGGPPDDAPAKGRRPSGTRGTPGSLPSAPVEHVPPTGIPSQHRPAAPTPNPEPGASSAAPESPRPTVSGSPQRRPQASGPP